MAHGARAWRFAHDRWNGYTLGDQRARDRARAARNGWMVLEVLPHEHHASVPVHGEQISVSTTRRSHEHLLDPMHRKLIPVETFSIAAGVKAALPAALQ